MPDPVLVIACGALARDIDELKKTYGWDHLHLKTINAWLHNRPRTIAGELRKTIRKHKDDYSRVFVAYADCGTSGDIDQVLDEDGIERLPGAHCYQFYAGAQRFNELAAAEPGTFYLTDFLAQHFERFVIEPLRLDQKPELRDAYFGNYRRLVYLSQRRSEVLLLAAREAADRLELEFQHVHTGYGELETALQRLQVIHHRGPSIKE